MDANERPSWFTSDAILRFAPLIAAGLVKVYRGPPEMLVGSQGAYPWPAKHLIELSERGQSLVDAWKKGDRSAFQEFQDAGKIATTFTS
jgi:hypothetical protein